jgi:DNA-binding transcriptional MerR regulator
LFKKGIMRIGDVARRSGVSVRAVRYYEEQRLLVAERTPNGQRTFPEAAVERVRLIQLFYAAGLSSRAIEQLLPSVDSGTATPEALDLLATERNRITSAISDLAQALHRLDVVIDHARNTDPEHCTAAKAMGALGDA